MGIDRQELPVADQENNCIRINKRREGRSSEMNAGDIEMVRHSNEMKNSSTYSFSYGDSF